MSIEKAVKFDFDFSEQGGAINLLKITCVLLFWVTVVDIVNLRFKLTLADPSRCFGEKPMNNLLLLDLTYVLTCLKIKKRLVYAMLCDGPQKQVWLLLHL